MNKKNKYPEAEPGNRPDGAEVEQPPVNKIYEVVEYRDCACGCELGPGERETVLFEHEDKSRCINFMKMFGAKLKYLSHKKNYSADPNKMDYFLHSFLNSLLSHSPKSQNSALSFVNSIA